MPAEYRSVLLILGLAAAGQLARWALLRPGEAPGGIVLVGASGPAGAPGAHRDSARTADRSLNEGEMVDLDRAGAAEIARLPGVGPGLARRIVLYREAHGPFASVEGLAAVPGIGPATIAKLRPFLQIR
jgi:competence protein ComEA